MASTKTSGREYRRQHMGMPCGGKVLASMASSITAPSDCPDLPQWSAKIRHVPGHPGYAVGDDGTVWSCRPCFRHNRMIVWRQLHPYIHPLGDLHVSIGSSRPKVARLVALTFIGPRPPKMDICHNDGNKLNNALENLRWDTRAGNMQDAIKHGTFHFAGAPGELNARAKLKESDVRQIRDHPDVPDVLYSRQYGVTVACIRLIRKRKTWTHIP